MATCHARNAGSKMVAEFLGWVSSLVLLTTLAQQVRTQWRSGESRGVSLWLFAGQIAASCGFALYSYLLGNWVFFSTNLLLVGNACVGQWVTWRNRRNGPQYTARGELPAASASASASSGE